MNWKRLLLPGAVFIALIVLNFRNRSHLSWLRSYGFPLESCRWTDQIPWINDRVVYGWQVLPLGLAADVAIAVALVLITLRVSSAFSGGVHAAA